MLLSEAFPKETTTYVCTDPTKGKHHQLKNIRTIQDCNQKNPVKLLLCFIQAFLVVLRTRPDVALSTGAAPGLLCLFWTRIFGGKTIWIDSIANSAEMSLSGKLASKFCHVTLSQWEHLSELQGIDYKGSVL